jgi:hypothetical protein
MARQRIVGHVRRRKGCAAPWPRDAAMRMLATISTLSSWQYVCPKSSKYCSSPTFAHALASVFRLFNLGKKGVEVSRLVGRHAITCGRHRPRHQAADLADFGFLRSRGVPPFSWGVVYPSPPFPSKRARFLLYSPSLLLALVRLA